MIKAIFAAVLGASTLVAASGDLRAQSSPGFSYGQAPSAGQWNGYFAAKQDFLGFTPLNRSGDTMVGKLTTQVPTTSGSGLNLPLGISPSVPNVGDVWTTSAGMYVRLNGATIGPLLDSSTLPADQGDVTGPYTARVVSKINGQTPSSFATSTDLGNATGTLSPLRFPTSLYATLIQPPTYTYGNYFNGVAASVIANCPTCVTGVMGGLENGAPNISTYPSLDSVAHFISNSNPPPIATTGSATTYDATHLYPSPALTSAQVAQLKIGMFVQTLHSTPFKGRILAWSPDGTSITMQDWSVFGNAASGQVPASGTGALVSAITKIWGQNVVTLMGNGGLAKDSIGYELDVACNLTGGCGATTDGSTGRSTGFEVVQVGTAGAADAFVARGTWNHGFTSWTGLICTFCADPTLQSFPNPSDGAFTTYQTGGTGFNFLPGHGASVFSVDYTGFLQAKKLTINGQALTIASTSGNSFINFNQTVSGVASTSARVGSIIPGYTQIWQGASVGLLASFIPPAGTVANSLGVTGGTSGNSAYLSSIGESGVPLGIGGSSVSGTPLQLQNSAAICTHTPTTASESVYCSSDAKLKRNIEEAHTALKWLDSFRVREYDTKSDGTHHTGVIAQEVRAVHPELVQETRGRCHDVLSPRAGCEVLLSVAQPDPWRQIKALQEVYALVKLLLIWCAGLTTLLISGVAFLLIRRPQQLVAGSSV